jgi:hypothetical protein
MMRDQLVEGLSQWLVGPLALQESFRDFPSLVYPCGMLFPKNTRLDISEDDHDKEDGRANDSALLDGIPNLTNAMKPSAAGFSFTVNNQTESIVLTGSFAIYLPRRFKELHNPNRGHFIPLGPINQGQDRANQLRWDAEWFRSQTDFRINVNLNNLGGPFVVGDHLCDQHSRKAENQTPQEDLEVSLVRQHIKLDVRLTEGAGFRHITCTLINQMDLSNQPRGEHNYDDAFNEPLGPWLVEANRNSNLDTPVGDRLPRSNKAVLDKATIYQVCLVAEGVNPGSFPFVEAPIRQLFTDDPDMLQHVLLYRRKREIAVGHGAGTNWENPSPDGKSFGRVMLDFLPSQKVPGLVTDREGLSDFLKMETLAGKAGEAGFKPSQEWGNLDQAVLNACTGLVDAYENWVNDRANERDAALGEIRLILQPADAHERIGVQANENLAACREAIGRMRAGIEVLRTDPKAMLVFNLANRAMWLQTRQANIQKGRAPDACSWRPFQLAFLLLSLRSIVKPDSRLPRLGNDGVNHGVRERDLVDLIWFPTGGGKTEAYLGLMAISLIYRRLRYDNQPDRGAGVGVITRYTLRLLTSQQFERATRLACALEVIRGTGAYGPLLGSEPFTIGLYVGGDSSPNHFYTQNAANPNTIQPGAQLVIHNIRNNWEYGNGKRDVRHLRKCPWCGYELVCNNLQTDYVVVDQNGNEVNWPINNANQANGFGLQFRCGGPDCRFNFHESHNSLPALIIDDEILRKPPSILIGTVDKFAMLAWGSDTKVLFGRNHPGRGNKYPTPDLVIQDELHLISGPLGTIVGAFEAGIGKLCQSDENLNGVPLGGPKIIGATATIRRAQEQVKALYAREVRQFPPQALTEGDSFFATTEPPDKPGRLYVGVQVPAQSAKTAYQKVAGALLGLKEELFDPNGNNDQLDTFHTLVAYFNSLRELSGASVLSNDNLTPYIETLLRHRSRIRGNQPNNGHMQTVQHQELTSRLNSGQITEILQQLELSQNQANSIRLLLATNMISVGVDVTRLGLMLINGMPKNTAEYIQASSRVGRDGPGLVVTLHGWTKSRDRSHYERFKQYHQAYYREVEATSVTPWTSSVRDSVLGAVIAMAYRHLVPQGGANPPGAADLQNFQALAESFLEIVSNVDPAEAQPTQEFINGLIERVSNYAYAHGNDLSYGIPVPMVGGPNRFLRVSDPINGPERGLIPAPTSMRDVEPSTQFNIYGI